MQQRTAQGHMDQGVQIEWEAVQSWLEKATVRETLAEVGLAAATLTVLGWTVFAFYKALQSYQMVGTGLF